MLVSIQTDWLVGAGAPSALEAMQGVWTPPPHGLEAPAAKAENKVLIEYVKAA